MGRTFIYYLTLLTAFASFLSLPPSLLNLAPPPVAHASDVSELSRVIHDIEQTEGLILAEGDAVTNKVIELKATLKKIVTRPAVTEIMAKLEYKGEPVWGLSTDERELVTYMRQKVNEA